MRCLEHNSVYTQVVAGGSGGALGRICTHPFDTVRTRLQTRTGIAESTGSTINLIRAIVRREGARGLYKGVVVATGVTFPALAIYLTLYDQLKSKFVASGHNANSAALHMFCGAAAEACSSALWTPMEVVKQRLQVDSSKQSRAWAGTQLLQSLLYKEGLRGVYRGYFLTLFVFVPQSAIFFSSYERFQALMRDNIGWKELDNSGELRTSEILLCGIMASTLSSALTNPLDCIKTNWQVNGYEGNTPNSVAKKYWNVQSVVRSVYGQYGWRGFTNGMLARVLCFAPSTAIAVTTYEYLKHKLDGHERL
eukprot:CFRG1141T1